MTVKLFSKFIGRSFVRHSGLSGIGCAERFPQRFTCDNVRRWGRAAFYSFLGLALLLCCSAVVFAAPAPVFTTGQTTSYTTGDDGDVGRGVAWPSPRFHNNGNGTVTDNLTGLIWLKDANCTDTVAGIAKTYGYLSWPDALAWSNSLSSGSCGLSDGSHSGDWRLPNREELEGLIDFGYYSPGLSNSAGTGQWTQGDPFNNVQSGYYWSSTTDAAIRTTRGSSICGLATCSTSLRRTTSTFGRYAADSLDHWVI